MRSAVKRFLTVTAAVLILAAAMCACSFGGGSSDGGSGKVDSIPEFHSYDLAGNEVDSSIFANADITVVNIWGTFCGPCVEEMPELAAWDEELPDNVQIVGIVGDVFSQDAAEYKDALDIVSSTGVKYTNIIASGELKDYMKNVSAYPTTLFVDKEGKFVHNPFVGADVGGYKDVVKSLTE